MTKGKVLAIPFDVAHLALMHMRPYEQETLSAAFIANLAKTATAKTHFIDGRILCIAGYVELWKGVREVYIIPSTFTSRYALPFQRAVKNQLDEWVKECHRLQTHSKADLQTDKWMESLGFHIEGILEKYTADQVSYRMWARLNNG